VTGFERATSWFEGTLEYALLFPGSTTQSKTVTFLRERGAKSAP
jgi:hypothetical protein